jgi:hypothetical protein
MRALHFMPCVLGAVLLVGCGGMQSFAPSDPPRESQACKGSCRIDVDNSPKGVPERVTIDNAKGPDGNGTRIEWDIRHYARVFRWHNATIEFQENGRKVFTNCSVSSIRKTFSCDNSGVTGDYKYTIHFWGEDPIDPWIFNR